MFGKKKKTIDKSPTDDVEYDAKALKDGAERTHATGSGGSDTADPEGEHDAGALKEGAKRMHAKK